MNWYDDYPHLGYDWDGKQILKSNSDDQLDYFLKRMEDPDFWSVETSSGCFLSKQLHNDNFKF